MPTDEEAQHQIGALPVRRIEGRLEVCLVTTRETRRWTIPKGWPMRNRKDWEAAAIEARDEAGLTGKMDRKPLGSFLYWKRRADHLDLIRVAVYRMAVAGEAEVWKEASQRSVRWFPVRVASEMVEEQGLVSILAGLADQESAPASG